jgi:hypothetical protein
MHPLVAPSAPGYVANRSSKLRFSWMMMTTCLMGLDPLPLDERETGGAPENAFKLPPEHETMPADATRTTKRALRLVSRTLAYSVSTGLYDGFSCWK